MFAIEVMGRVPVGERTWKGRLAAVTRGTGARRPECVAALIRRMRKARECAKDLPSWTPRSRRAW